MASTKHRTDIELERLTGIRERRIAGEGEDSYTLALGAARDALAHADCAAEDLDMLIVSSISRHVGGLRMQLEPPVSVSLKEALGARRAISFDLSNACAGMMTGVFILNDLIRQGRIRRGMVVSGEYISQLGRNAAHEVRTMMSDQLASLTLGDAGAAAILERAPEGAPGIEVAGFTTLSEHSRLCMAFPAKIARGDVDAHRCPGDPQGRDRGLGAAAARGARSGRARVRRDRLLHPAPDVGAGDQEGREGLLREPGRRAEARGRDR